MAEKRLKSVVNAVITREQWHRVPKTRAAGFDYRCTGEVRNIGVSEIRALIVIGAIYNPHKKELLSIVDTSFRRRKIADYICIPTLKVNESMSFDISIEVPDVKRVLLGKNRLKNLDRKLLNGDLRHHAFLVFDAKHLDDRTRKWFKDEEAKRVVFHNQQWDLGIPKGEEQAACTFQASVQNVGLNDLDDFDIITAIVKSGTGESLSWTITRNPQTGEALPEAEYTMINAAGSLTVKDLKPRQGRDVQVAFYLPPELILRSSRWTLKSIQEGIAKGELEYKASVNYKQKSSGPEVYRDSYEDPTVIEELKGTRRIEMVNPQWQLEAVGQGRTSDYTCEGTVKNTGSVAVENIYVIGSIADPASGEALSWESGHQFLKTLEIESIPYLNIGEERNFKLTLSLPKRIRWKKDELTAADIVAKIRTGELKQMAEVYYNQEDLQEEGTKRLNLGNAYFRLGNIKAGIKEYREGLKLLPEDRQLRMNLALTLYKVSRIEDALKELNALLQHTPGHKEASYLRGLVRMKMEQYTEAIADFTTAMKPSESNEMIKYNIACCHFLGKRPNQGYRWLTEAMEDNYIKILQKANQDPDLEAYRKNPEFIAFLQKTAAAIAAQQPRD